MVWQQKHCFAVWAQIKAGKAINDGIERTRVNAHRFLGLTYWEANWVFAAERTLEELNTLRSGNCGGIDRNAPTIEDCSIFNMLGRAGYNHLTGFNYLGFDPDGLDKDNKRFGPPLCTIKMITGMYTIHTVSGVVYAVLAPEGWCFDSDEHICLAINLKKAEVRAKSITLCECAICKMNFVE